MRWQKALNLSLNAYFLASLVLPAINLCVLVATLILSFLSCKVVLVKSSVTTDSLQMEAQTKSVKFVTKAAMDAETLPWLMINSDVSNALLALIWLSKQITDVSKLALSVTLNLLQRPVDNANYHVLTAKVIRTIAQHVTKTHCISWTLTASASPAALMDMVKLETNAWSAKVLAQLALTHQKLALLATEETAKPGCSTRSALTTVLSAPRKMSKTRFAPAAWTDAKYAQKQTKLSVSSVRVLS